MKKSGFTLIEILVSIVILGIVAVIGSQMFFSILKNTAKTRTLAEVKQNGNHALAVMIRMIRNARSIELNSDDQTCELGMKKLKIMNPDWEWTEFQFNEDPDPEKRRVIFATESHTDDLTSGEVAIDTTKAYTFDCIDPGDGPPTVTINFTLIQVEVGARAEEAARVDFRTTVSLRTY